MASHQLNVTPEPNQALQRMLRARHVSCLRTNSAVPSASLSLRSLGVATRTVRTALLFLSVFGGFALAEPPELPLPKCYIPLFELAGTCKGALVATLVSVSDAVPGPSGASDFLSHWKVIKTLRGNYPGDAELSFRVQTIAEPHRERKPTIGQTYILISYDINATQIAYIFEHTDDKLREIQQLSAKSK